MIDKDKLQNLRETVESIRRSNEKNINSVISECYLDDDILPLLEKLLNEYTKSMDEIVDEIEEIIGEE